ncbi:MAG: HAMP domain-containing histidine kinase [Oscillospiraceae bacterium]|nr:HAMP domain-containing histidine kinase [Oscillospiraceae bacterium]
MKHSIYIRNFLATALIVLISFSLLGGISTAWNYRRSLNDRRASMVSTIHETARYVATEHLFYGTKLDDLNLSMWLAIISNISGFDLLLTDLDGVVTACSDSDFRHLGKSVPESSLTSSIAGNVTMTLSTLGEIYSERRQVTGIPLSVSINNEIHIFGYLFVTSDLASFRLAWQQFTSVFVIIALNVMILAFVISFITTKKQAEPLDEMASAARRFAHGEFSARVDDYDRTDEIGQLAQAFNAMADSLESAEALRRGFIANLSHELKTPMTVISGFAEGLLDGTIPYENADRYLSIISSETRRLSRLVGSMLDISMLQSADVSTVLRYSFDISELVRIALLSFESKIEDKKLQVEAELPEEPVMTRGDKDAITQVVFNLIDNAVKFSDTAGKFKIELWKQGDRAYISFENSGETIPAEEIPHIFERFHKADKSRSADPDGVGLGLYIVKTILDNHNEDVYVTSNDGVTRFVFTLTIA